MSYRIVELNKGLYSRDDFIQEEFRIVFMDGIEISSGKATITYKRKERDLEIIKLIQHFFPKSEILIFETIGITIKYKYPFEE